jgi:hypothetical protein
MILVQQGMLERDLLDRAAAAVLTGTVTVTVPVTVTFTGFGFFNKTTTDTGAVFLQWATGTGFTGAALLKGTAWVLSQRTAVLF